MLAIHKISHSYWTTGQTIVFKKITTTVSYLINFKWKKTHTLLQLFCCQEVVVCIHNKRQPFSSSIGKILQTRLPRMGRWHCCRPWKIDLKLTTVFPLNNVFFFNNYHHFISSASCKTDIVMVILSTIIVAKCLVLRRRENSSDDSGVKKYNKNTTQRIIKHKNLLPC